MKNFTKSELKIVGIILLVTALVSLQNFKVSIRRARDAQRKGDARTIYQALEAYHADFGFYPLATEDGKILACEKEVVDVEGARSIVLEERLRATMDPCEWGEDSLADFTDPEYPPYLNKLPRDPHWEDGVMYRYDSTTRNFQILAALEGTDEAEYDPSIEVRGVSCGSRICNYGRAPGSVPLDKSLQEYENETIE